MFTKIQRIRAFGCYQNFQWPGELPTFNRYNVCYGWNYSGKTTLSRAIRTLELKAAHVDFPGGEVAVELDGGAVCGTGNLAAVPALRVFNADFVRENVQFETSRAHPILILGRDDIEKQRELDELRADLTKLDANVMMQNSRLQGVSQSIREGMTEEARKIKNTLLIPNYERPDFEPNVTKVEADPAAVVMNDTDFATTLLAYKSEEKKRPISEDLSPPDFHHLRERVIAALARCVKGEALPRLQADPALEKWISAGRALHSSQDKCQFCESELPSGLMERYAKHFSDEYDSFMATLKTLREDINVSRVKDFPDLSSRLYPELVGEYARLRDGLTALIEKRRAALNVLDSAVEAKQTSAFTPRSLPQVEDVSEDIESVLRRISEVVQKHNDKTSQFEQERQKARERLELHYAGKFVIDRQLPQKREAERTIKAELAVLQERQTALRPAIRKLEELLSNAVKGAEQLNRILVSFFSKEDLRVEVAQGHFEIRRGTNVAKNLSEGEKTAIAFAYFTTRLKDKDTNLAETIVVIDDPVSSLDSNHLFNVVALIRTELEGCKQLIVSTHNYEFFNLIREWYSDIEDLRQKKNKDLTKWRAYLVERRAAGSVLRDLPDELMRFKSEYHFLFASLYTVDPEVVDFAQLFNLPNIARRFLEAFAGIMIPARMGLDKKMPKLFPDAAIRERVWKFVNHYSHNKDVTRSITIPDASECKSVIKLCLEAVRAWDDRHFAALVDAIS